LTIYDSNNSFRNCFKNLTITHSYTVAFVILSTGSKRFARVVVVTAPGLAVTKSKRKKNNSNQQYKSSRSVLIELITVANKTRSSAVIILQDNFTRMPPEVKS